MLEKVQRRATRMVYGFNDLTYEQRLRRLNITSLETSRPRGNLIEVFKIVKDFGNITYISISFIYLQQGCEVIVSSYLRLLLNVMSGNTLCLMG